MAASWQSAVQPHGEETLALGVPGILIAVQRGDAAPEYAMWGTDGRGQALAADTLLPVASITKLATALAVLRLVASGSLSLDAPLRDLLPDAAVASEPITPRMLLCHISGVPGELPEGAAPYTRSLSWQDIARASLSTPVERTPRTSVEYSNLGYSLLAIIVERTTGQPFTKAVADLVIAPLRLEAYLGAEPPRPVARITGNYGEHLGTELEPFNTPFWRALALPYGGMITTAAGSLALVRAFAGAPTGFLPAELRVEAITDQTGGVPGSMVGVFHWPHCPWGLGPDLRGRKEPHFAPLAASPASFGHAGASGCLVWCDPDADLTWSIHGTHTSETWWQKQGSISEAILTCAR